MCNRSSFSRRSLFKTGFATLSASAALSGTAAAESMLLSHGVESGPDVLPKQKHRVDFCVVGGGMSGLCAAVAAARHGVKVALIQERPVLGGNASSEIRMHVCGAHGKNMRETGIIDEIQMDNAYRNPSSNYSLWDSVLYEKARFEPNILLMLNCTVNDIVMQGKRIRAVKAWQMTTQTWHTVEADFFADCSGDSILAPLSGAEFRIGRESSREFNEDIMPDESDRKTMGMTCLFQAREYDAPRPYIPPEWANVYATDDDLPNRNHDIMATNFWWMELGGEDDSIHDSETLRDELLKVAFGVWDHIKNRGDHNADNWELDWVGFLPGKRESRRYVGDHLLNQNDVRAEGRFDDLVAYGGWTMDDHHPGGIRFAGKPTTFHPAPSPFGIPYRSLYSRNIENLFCAGRNISTTHAAMSATRVMATCATVGQAAGTAAAIAVSHSSSPRGVYDVHLEELRQALMDDDSFLPWGRRGIAPLSQNAKIASSSGPANVLLNGVDRPFEGDENGIELSPGDTVTFTLSGPREIRMMRLVFDSDLNNKYLMPTRYSLDGNDRAVPPMMAKGFHVEVRRDSGWKTIKTVQSNHRRLVKLPLTTNAAAIRFVLDETWGGEKARVFACEIA